MRTIRIIQVSVLVLVLLASMVPAKETQAWLGCGSMYVVQRGDWLAKIARKCGVTLADLYAANPWARYERYIYPGQWLTIPGGWDGWHDDSPYYCGPVNGYYVVCRGDTLGGIAMYYGVNYQYLQWRNGIHNANLIYPGQIIWP